MPEQARLDIFERVNGGVPLTRQQMRNCLCMGEATRFLKTEANSPLFLKATGKSLQTEKMRDREFVNRFCAFQLLPLEEYRSDMDDFLANALKRMNDLDPPDLQRLSAEFRTGLSNNFKVFREHAFRRSAAGDRRSLLNASLWDVMTTGLSRYPEPLVEARTDALREAFYALMKEEKKDEEKDRNFVWSITYGPNDLTRVRYRFKATKAMFEEVLGAHPA